MEKIGREGARTIPGRPEHGGEQPSLLIAQSIILFLTQDLPGNCDIKNLSRGSKVYLPVHVPGAKFSVGDLHFSQGDGEISFCGAIEMAGVITINFKVLKNGIANLGLKSPIYMPGPVEPQFGPGRYIYFEGFSVDEKGKQRISSPFPSLLLTHILFPPLSCFLSPFVTPNTHQPPQHSTAANHNPQNPCTDYLDVTVAYRQTALRCIEYLRRFGYSPYQAYLLLSCAPVQGHVAGIVDIPNACTTLGLPIDIFGFDISPSAGAVAGGIQRRDMGRCAFETGVGEGVVVDYE